MLALLVILLSVVSDANGRIIAGVGVGKLLANADSTFGSSFEDLSCAARATAGQVCFQKARVSF